MGVDSDESVPLIQKEASSEASYQSKTLSSSYIQPSWLLSALAVTAFALVLRIYKIDDPSEVVFDEVHFGKFASFYLVGTYFFDVHPPLGKLLIAAVGGLSGYDGSFMFNDVGEDYKRFNVPFVQMRLFCAVCGTLIVPTAFLILKEMGASLAGCIFGSLILAIDNAMIVQSRFIFLDSMLLLFGLFSILSWIKFYRNRFNAFSFVWWFWLTMTGICLGLTLGVKLVGLFTIVTVGFAVLHDLYTMIDAKRAMPLKIIGKHFIARVFCLVMVPITIYLGLFYLHFHLLPRSGPGDNRMSIEFQYGLEGSMVQRQSQGVQNGSIVSVRNLLRQSYLFTNRTRYILRYPDARVSSMGAIVSAVKQPSNQTDWIVETVNETTYDLFNLERKEMKEGDVVLSGDLIRLRHRGMGLYLSTHDVAAPLIPTNSEVTLANGTLQFNQTIWRIVDANHRHAHGVRTNRNCFHLEHLVMNVSLSCSHKILPEWGYGGLEVDGTSKGVGDVWYFSDSSIQSSESNERERTSLRQLSFLEKFLELHSAMIESNSALTGKHSSSSDPITWPFLLRGLPFWARNITGRQVFLIGNPLIWWTCAFSVIGFSMYWCFDRIKRHRGIQCLPHQTRKWIDRSIGFMLLAWAFHYIPFFMMGRVLYLHHYLPSFIYSVLVLTLVLEFFGRNFPAMIKKGERSFDDESRDKRPSSITYLIFLVLVMAAFAAVSLHLAPLSYALELKTTREIESRQLFKSWNIQFD